MFQKFDEELQKVIKLAKNEMNELKHEYVGTEHIVLGILNTENDVCSMLNKYNINYEKYKDKLIETIGVGKKDNNLFLYTPLLKRVIENAINNSKNNGRDYVSLKDLFFSIIDEGDGIAIRILIALNLDIDKIYIEMSKNIHKRINNKRKMILDELGVNLNKKAKDGLLDPVIGRGKEINRLIEILCRRTKNNPILIGSAGVGKTAIVEELASRIESGNVPNILLNKKIISLDMASSVAGTKYRGEFEERMKKVLIELEESDEIILFIDEIHTIMGAGGAEGAIDASNIFKPALARGKMRCIGATTTDEYKKYIEKDSALDRRFQKLEVKEPNNETLKEILMKIKKIYENHHNVLISEKMIDKIIYYGNKYIKERTQPDKSIDILDEVCSKVSLKFNKKEKRISGLKKELINVINRKNKYIIDNNFKKAYELKLEEESLSSLINEEEINKNSKVKCVYENDIVDVIKIKTNMPILEMNNKYIEVIKSKLNKEVIGQQNAIEKMLKVGRRINNSYDNSCISILLCGKSGVGKTMLAKKYAELIVGKDNVIKLDMSEYSEPHSISKIIGSPPGYVGYSDTKNVLEEIKDKPNNVLILDEIEKCNKNVLNLFLKAIDEGYIKDSRGRIINFENTTIIMTTNVNFDNNLVGFNIKTNSVKDDIKDVLGKELVSRVSSVILLDSIDISNIKNIIVNKITELENKYKVTLSVSNNVIDNLIKLSEFEKCGARKINDIIKSNIEDYLFYEILNNNDKIIIDNLNLVTN